MVISSTTSLDSTAVITEASNDSALEKTCGKKNTTITDFVDSSFAAVDSNYPTTAQTQSQGSRFKMLANEAAEERSKSKKEKKANTRNSDPAKSEQENDEDDAYATFTYLAILTALYLPFLLFLWIRRNVFGTASLVKSLFFGHMLRFSVAFLLLPPSTTKTFVPTPVWNLGIKILAHGKKFWYDRRTQAMIPDWLHVVLSMILGFQTDNQTIGGGALEKAKKSWPPPGVICFIVFTILSFVVHPDGITWIMIGQIQEFVYKSAVEAAEYIQGLRNGTIKMKPSEVSGTLASIIIIVTIVNSILSNRKKDRSVPHREKASKHKHKRGKKGRGRNHHGSSSTTTNKARIKGGHYRSSKDLYEGGRESSPPPVSRSLSPSKEMRTLSDEDSTVSTTSDSNQRSIDVPCAGAKEVSTGRKEETLPTAKSRSDDEISVPKFAAVQVCDDEKSCASSVATTHTNTTTNTSENGNGNRKKSRRNKSRRAAQKMSTTTPRVNNKTTPVMNSVSSPARSQKSLSQDRLQKTGSEKQNVRKIRQNHRDKLGFGKEIVTSDLNSVNKTMQQPRQQNRRRSFTAPEIKTSQKSKLSCEKLDTNGEQSDNISLTSLPISRTQQETLKLEPLTPVISAMNNVTSRNELPKNDHSVDLQNTGMNEEKKFVMKMNGRSYVNSFGSSVDQSPAAAELSEFLVRLGFVGSVYAQLMIDLASVESFFLFTDADYFQYGIGPAKRAEILSHLESRNARRAIENNQSLGGWNNPVVVRPPPGLGAPSISSDYIGAAATRIVSPVGAPVQKTGNTIQQQTLPYFTTPTPTPSAYSLTPGSSLNSFSGPLGHAQNHDVQLHGANSQLPLEMPQSNGGELCESASNHITLPPISPLKQNMNLSLHPSSKFTFALKEHNDEEIEADLQKLGGQMAGSILDF